MRDKINREECPYCKKINPPVCVRWNDHFQVQCFGCGCRGPYSKTSGEAWDGWRRMFSMEDKDSSMVMTERCEDALPVCDWSDENDVRKGYRIRCGRCGKYGPCAKTPGEAWELYSRLPFKGDK